jgi:hypothetical protein
VRCYPVHHLDFAVVWRYRYALPGSLQGIKGYQGLTVLPAPAVVAPSLCVSCVQVGCFQQLPSNGSSCCQSHGPGERNKMWRACIVCTLSRSHPQPPAGPIDIQHLRDHWHWWWHNKVLCCILHCRCRLCQRSPLVKRAEAASK